jgi:hypothetical protein
VKGPLTGQQTTFKIKCIHNESRVSTSNVAAKITAKPGSPFTIPEFVKQYKLAVTEEDCANRKMILKISATLA